MTLFRDTFLDRAPKTLTAVTRFTGWKRPFGSKQIKKKTDVKNITDELLELLTKAYEEAAN